VEKLLRALQSERELRKKWERQAKSAPKSDAERLAELEAEVAGYRVTQLRDAAVTVALEAADREGYVVDRQALLDTLEGVNLDGGNAAQLVAKRAEHLRRPKPALSPDISTPTPHLNFSGGVSMADPYAAFRKTQ